MTNPNQQLLDYAVENIKEWNDRFTDLYSDSSWNSLFWGKGFTWFSSSSMEWAYNGNCSCSIIYEHTLGKTTPQVITKDEWLAEIKRREEEKPMILKQDSEYNVKLTGQEIFDLYLITGSLKGSSTLYSKFQAMLGDNINAHISMNVALPLIKLTEATGYSEALTKAFKVPETEEQRHLRELKEQYESLGEKIKQLSK